MLAETRHRPVADLPTTLDRDHTITSFSGHLLVNGERPPIWADLSGLYRISDGTLELEQVQKSPVKYSLESVMNAKESKE